MLLSWYPISPYMPRVLHCTCYPWSIAQQHNVIVLGSCQYPCLLPPQRASERVPATILGPLQRPGDYLQIQYEVNGKAAIHDAAALHHLEFDIRSPSPSPSTSSKPEPDGQEPPAEPVLICIVQPSCCPSWTHQEISATIQDPSGNNRDHPEPIRKCCLEPFCEGLLGGGGVKAV